MAFLKTSLTLALAVALAATLALSLAPGQAPAGDLAAARRAIIASYAKAAGRKPSAERGRKLFQSRHSGGKPATPSCTVCHTTDPHNYGRTRVGKVIKPMAVSSNPARFTDPKKVAKWIRRNCKTVLGRECTALEKADVLTYLSSL